ncbi:hypothetical protein [Desulforamulus aquiferis]|uniref:Uncharacterized protein n=1 Tax=Desulforamulus aquiferis TaxID=1397668 RepID=A0AAW7ZH65_9FIRM|nr:hypothetical protein [Desulforamulus aquiferis]MDO7788795.1 hypothetical protein [Desulforamulus aquiferis]
MWFKLFKEQTGAAMIGVTIVVGLTIGTIGSSPYISDTLSPKNNASIYPKNSNGQTYGSALYANSPEEEPDLISVLGDHGKSGYALKQDFYGPEPNTPEEALVYMRNRPKVNKINVYATDGKTIIDTYSIFNPTIIIDVKMR